MNALTVRQPWATLLCDPTLPKWIETRSRRTHVRGTIGIIAGKHRPVCGVHHDDGTWSLHVERDRVVPLPLGALIGTVDLYDCIPIVAERGCPDAPDCPNGMITVAGPHSGYMGHLTWLTWKHAYYGRGRYIDKDRSADAETQRPYGDFRPGRWAWLTRNAVLFDEAIPMRGAQHWQEVDT